MKKDIKKIIAKEGLILLGIILISLVIIFTLLTTEFAVVGEQLGQRIVTFTFMLVLLGYPAYLLGRFVIWAIRTLKDE